MDNGSSLIINSGTYRENSTTNTSTSYGGGFIYNRKSQVEIYGGSFINNMSAGRGGCIYNAGLEGTETYLYGGYFQGNKSTYEYNDGKGSGAVFYSSENTAATVINLSGNVQFCGDGVAGSGVDGVFLGLASNAARKAQISSELKYPLALYLVAEEGRVIAEGVNGYTLQKRDMKKITFTDVGTSGTVWYAKLDETNNQIILTTTNPGYQLYVTYDANGGKGNVSDSREYSSGDTVTVQSGDSLRHDGYSFEGWNTKPDGTGTAYQADNTFQITGDITLYAQWTRNTHNVTYNYSMNGGISATKTSDTVAFGGQIDLTPTAELSGWEFVGWNTDKNAEAGLTSLTMGAEDITLYAIYKKEITITFYSGSVGEYETFVATQYNNKTGTTVTYPTLKELNISGKDGYTAYGWGIMNQVIGQDIYEAGSSLYWSNPPTTYWGVYQKEITVSYDANGGSGDAPESQTITTYAIVSENKCVLYTADAITLPEGSGLKSTGYTFDGWIEGNTTGKGMTAGTEVKPTADTVYYASWVPNTYTVNLHTNGGSSGTTLISYTYGTGATLPTDWRKTGYSFAGWYDNEECNGEAVTNISGTATGDKKYWAKWTDDIAPVMGALGYSYEPENLWQWLIGRESLIITVPVTEEGSGADEITYTVTPAGGTAREETSAIANGEAKITVSADFKGTISIVCTDKAGNTSAGVTVGADLNGAGIIIEDHAPQIEFKAENAELLQMGDYKTAPDITVTVTDNKDNAISGGIASVSYQIGNGSIKTVDHDYMTSMIVNDSFTISASEISAGETVISVTATDHAGNSVTITQTIKVHIHSGTLVAATEATCTTAGNKEHYTCTCGKWFSDSGCMDEITESDTKIEVLAHDFSGSYQHDAKEHWKVCSCCDIKDTAYTHRYDNNMDEYCNDCGYKRVIGRPDTDHEDNPDGKQPVPQPPSPTNPAEQSQPTNSLEQPQPADMPDNQLEDRQEPESTGTPEPTEKPSGTEKEQLLVGDGEQTVPASIDNGKIAISGEPVVTGNLTENSEVTTKFAVGEGAVIVTVVCEDEKYAAGAKDTVAVANAVLTREQIQLVNDGETIEVRIDVKDISESVAEQDKEAIERGLTQYRKEMPELTLGMYVDISMFIRIGESGWDTISSTEEPIEVTIGIPEELKEEDREFYIIRSHEGEYTLLPDMDDDPETITISTDKFSAYAFAYEQADKAEQGARCGLCHICPTFLGICYFVWLAIFILVIIIVIILLRKKKEEQEARDIGQ